jgi:predicted glycosyltransferase
MNMKLKRKSSLESRDGGKMKIWYDACTGKHVRYGTAIARRLRSLGHEVLLTTRKHPDTLELAKTLDESFVPVGKYEPATLFTRLEASAERIIELSRMLQHSVPDVALSSQSVELCRVAFGLGIPIILTADTPHATAVNKLTIPFASILLVSEAIPKRLFNNYGMAKVFRFRGVDEVAWIKDLRVSQKSEVEKPLIVVRQMETAAVYALGKTDVTSKIAQQLTSLGNVLFLPRYDRSEIEGLTITKNFVDSARLTAHADLVVSVGGTLAREAALQGVPSIVISEFGRTWVNKYLSDKEFPLFITSASEVFTMAEACIGKKWNVTEKLASLENPVDAIERIIEKHFY